MEPLTTSFSNAFLLEKSIDSIVYSELSPCHSPVCWLGFGNNWSTRLLLGVVCRTNIRRGNQGSLRKKVLPRKPKETTLDGRQAFQLEWSNVHLFLLLLVLFGRPQDVSMHIDALDNGIVVGSNKNTQGFRVRIPRGHQGHSPNDPVAILVLTKVLRHGHIVITHVKAPHTCLGMQAIINILANDNSAATQSTTG